MPDRNDKYWKDYTQFISEVERLTRLSPADLISRYTILVEELTDIDEDYYLEWQYEFDNDLWTRQKIQFVLESELLAENQLLTEFRKNIEELDKALKVYVKNSNDPEWWKDPEIEFKKENPAANNA